MFKTSKFRASQMGSRPVASMHKCTQNAERITDPTNSVPDSVVTLPQAGI